MTGGVLRLLQQPPPYVLAVFLLNSINLPVIAQYLSHIQGCKMGGSSFLCSSLVPPVFFQTAQII